MGRRKKVKACGGLHSRHSTPEPYMWCLLCESTKRCHPDFIRSFALMKRGNAEAHHKIGDSYGCILKYRHCRGGPIFHFGSTVRGVA